MGCINQEILFQTSIGKYSSILLYVALTSLLILYISLTRNPVYKQYTLNVSICPWMCLELYSTDVQSALIAIWEYFKSLKSLLSFHCLLTHYKVTFDSFLKQNLYQ